jgi:hypothetical protein
MLLAGLAVAAVAAIAAVFLFANRGDDTPPALADSGEAAAESTDPTQPGGPVTLDAADEQLLVELAADPPAIDAATTARLTAALVGLNVPAAANDREEMRGLIGPPDAFDLTFETNPQEPAAPLLRVETWHYFDFGSAYVFVDGRLANSFPVEALGDIALLPLQYDPAAFSRSMTWEQAAALIDDPAAGSISDFDTADVGADLDVYAGPQILLMFDADGLAAVSTIPLTPSDD